MAPWNPPSRAPTRKPERDLVPLEGVCHGQTIPSPLDRNKSLAKNAATRHAQATAACTRDTLAGTRLPAPRRYRSGDDRFVLARGVVACPPPETGWRSANGPIARYFSSECGAKIPACQPKARQQTPHSALPGWLTSCTGNVPCKAAQTTRAFVPARAFDFASVVSGPEDQSIDRNELRCFGS